MAGATRELSNSADFPVVASVTGTEIIPGVTTAGAPVGIPTQLLLGGGGGASIGYTTKAALLLDLAWPARTIAEVAGDPTPANNGYYLKAGANGAGSWSYFAAPRYNFQRLTNAGAGSANVIVTTSATPVTLTPYATIYSTQITHESTGHVTLSANGTTAPLRDQLGVEIPPGALQVGEDIWFSYSGTEFRLAMSVLDRVNDAAIQAIQRERVIEDGDVKALISSEYSFGAFFTDRVALGVHKRDGAVKISRKMAARIGADVIAGNVWAWGTNGVRRQITHMGDAQNVWVDDTTVHISRRIEFPAGSGLYRGHHDRMDVSLLNGGARGQVTTLGGGVTRLLQLAIIGQSVSVGGVQTSVVTTSAADPTRGIMFWGGARPMDAALEFLAPSTFPNYDPTLGIDEATLALPNWTMERTIGCYENQVGTANGETWAAGIIHQLLARLPSTTAILVSGHGVGATPMSTYRKGSMMYDNMMRAAEHGRLLATMLGLSYVHRGVVQVAGEEAQNANPSSTWRDAEIAFQAEFDADLKLIAEESSTKVLWLPVLSSWTKLGSPVTTSNIAEGCFLAARVDNSKIKIPTPRYPFEHTNPDKVHLTNVSTKVAAEYVGRDVAQLELSGTVDEDMRCLSAVVIAGPKLRTTWNWPVADLTSIITGLGGNRGCRVTVTSGTVPGLSNPTVSSTYVLDFDMTVTVNPGTQGPKFGIADYDVVGAGTGPDQGPRTSIGRASADTAYDGRLMARFPAPHTVTIT